MPVTLRAFLFRNPARGPWSRGETFGRGFDAAGKLLANYRRADRSVGERIDHDQASGCPILLVAIEKEGRTGGKFNRRNLIHLQLLGRMLARIVDVHPETDPRSFCS